MDPIIEVHPRSVSPWQELAVIPRLPSRAGSSIISPGRNFPPETFDDFDLWISVKGESNVEILGHTQPLNAGTCLILPPMVSATQTMEPKTYFHHVFFHFDMVYRGEILRDARPYVKLAPHGSLVLALPGLPSFALFAPTDTARLAERLLLAVRRWDDVTQLQSLAIIMNLLAEHRREAVRPTGRSGRGASVVDVALQYLEDNLHRPVFVPEMAKHLRISPTHLTRLFRVQLQQTPMQALVHMRLSRAQVLMRNPTLNISEIAAACGFESLSFFTRVFSRTFGSPPTAYRRSLVKTSAGTR